MNKPWEVIKKLEADNSRLAKEAILAQEAQAGNHDLFLGCRLALDPMITFGLKQVPEKKDTECAAGGLGRELFVELCRQLKERIVTGNNARGLVDRAMQMATQDEWNFWYRRILIKDLRCGLSEKTINKVVEKKYAKYIIPVFSCQLSHDSSNHDDKVRGRKLIEVKLDGVRVITVVYPDGRVDQFSRNGKELVNFPHIKEQFSKITDRGVITEPWVFDGEIMSSSFQDLMKQVHRKENVAAADAVLHLFDGLSLKDFEAGHCATKQSERSQQVFEFVDTYRREMPNVAALNHEIVDLDTEEGQAKFKEINQRAIAGGYEGIMIKDPAAPYECKRTVNWLKLKPFIEVSLEVVDFEEGTGRNAGRLGAIICEGQDDGRRIRVNVGSGFSDSDRDSYWTGRDKLSGQIVEVRADAITQNQDGSYSLRFPRFLRFRGFRAGEKI